MGYSHGKRWSEQEILDKIKYMVEELELKTFPTHSQMDKFYNSCGLSNAISKRGGTQKYAEIMGLEIKKSETEFGERLEQHCLIEIEEKIDVECQKTNSRYPYDILVGRSVKVDVKASKLFCNYGDSKYYSFNLEKKEQTCDIFVFYCIDENNNIEKTLIIPSVILSGKKQLSIGRFSSRYGLYEDRWDYIEKYYKFMKECV
jgi:hypothetical protein